MFEFLATIYKHCTSWEEPGLWGIEQLLYVLRSKQVVVSVEGYLATVFLLEKSLSFKVPQQGISEVANSLGLLDRTKAWIGKTRRS